MFSLAIIKEITSPEYLTRGDGTMGTNIIVGIDALLNELLAEIEDKGLRYEYEERAAILEYDGGLDRVDADRAAAVEVLRRY
jgi:hypothetical protein